MNKMIKTNVDRTIELLSEKGKADVKGIAKTLGAKPESIDLILTYLEEEGIVELKYGVTTTIASIKKEKEKKLPPKKEKKPEKPPVEEEKPKPVLVAKPLLLPKYKLPPIPRFDEAKIIGKEKMNAKLTNMIIDLLEKFYAMPEDKQANAVLVLNDILRLAKENKLYKQKGAMSAEFILCSLLISIEMLIGGYEVNKNINLAKKIHSAYHLMGEIAMKIDRIRIEHYKGLINTIYNRIMVDIYPEK